MLLIMFYHGNLQDYLMKVLNHLQQLITVLQYYYDTKTKIKFTRSCLKQSGSIFTHKKIVNIYNVYELAVSSSHNSDPSEYFYTY